MKQKLYSFKDKRNIYHKKSGIYSNTLSMPCWFFITPYILCALFGYTDFVIILKFFISCSISTSFPDDQKNGTNNPGRRG
jgi:hypothetical protein